MSDLLLDLQSLIEKFKLMPPVAVAFWCVDRPGEAWRLRDLYQKTVSKEAGSCFDTGIPVYEWYSWLADDDDRTKRPNCFRVPGVYAKMSDGTWRTV